MANHSSYREVLAIQPFRLLWFGQICSQLAVNTLLFVLALRLYQTTGSNTAVSGLFLAYGIPAMIFGMIAGTAVDHLDKRRVLVYCDAIRAVMVFLLFFFSGNLLVVYLVTLINAVITQFYVPAELPTIPRLVPAEHIVPANSLFSLTFFSSLAIGSIAAGPLYRVFGYQWIFFIIAGCFALASWLESQLPPMAVGVLGFRTVLAFDLSHIITRIWTKLVEGLQYVKTMPILFDSLLLLTGTQIIFMMLGTLGPGFADKVLGIDIRDASLYIVGPAVVGILLGSVWVGNVGSRFRPRSLINAGVISAGLSLFVISLIVRVQGFGAFAQYIAPSTRLILASCLFFILGVANSLLDSPANSLLQEKAKGSMRGRVYGMLTSAVGGVGILPVVAGGILADIAGVGRVILVLGLVILVYGIYRMKYNKI